MPVSDNGSLTQVVLTAVPQTITFNPAWFDASDLVVKKTNQATPPVTSTLTITTHYTLSGGSGSGGSVTILAGAAAIGDTITIERQVPYASDMDLSEGDPLPSAVLEQRVDRLTVQVQQVRDMFNRALGFLATSGAIAKTELLDPTSRFLFINSSDQLVGLTGTQAAAEIGEDIEAFQSTTFADSSARGSAVPDYVGQLGVQIDSGVIYRATALTAGSWTATTASQIADGIVTAAKLGASAVETAKIADDVVTYAKLQNVSATSRILGRKTAGAGDPEECTLSQVLDFVGSAADGDVLYRNGGSWTRLAKGTDGQVLTLAGGVPTWAANPGAWNAVSSVAASNSAAVDFTGLSASYRMHRFQLHNVVPANDDVNLQLLISDDNGATWEVDAADYRYIQHGFDEGATARQEGSGGDTKIILAGGTTTNENIGSDTGEHGVSGWVEVYSPANSSFKTLINWKLGWTNPAGNLITNIGTGIVTATAAINGVRFICSAGNVESGIIDYYTVTNPS